MELFDNFYHIVNYRVPLYMLATDGMHLNMYYMGKNENWTINNCTFHSMCEIILYMTYSMII